MGKLPKFEKGPDGPEVEEEVVATKTKGATRPMSMKDYSAGCKTRAFGQANRAKAMNGRGRH